MITIVLFDLGDTLERGGSVLPGVPQALSAIQQIVTLEGEPLVMCLASDYTMPAQPTVDAVNTLFQEYLTFVEGLGLRRYFEPVDKRVTLSTQAGVLKPERQFFETALQRADLSATPLSSCLFVTEFAPHIEACRNMGMATLQFGGDFTTWTEAPALVAHLVDPANPHNLEVALRPAAAALGVDLQTIDKVAGPSLHGTARQLVPLQFADLGPLEGVHVPVTVAVELRLDTKGRIADLRSGTAPADINEAADYVRSLLSNRQVAGLSGGHNDRTLPTHAVETDPEGRRRLVRRRFTAV